MNSGGTDRKDPGMGDEIVSEFMRERRARMKTEEKTLKEFIKDLQNFRKASASLNESGIAVLDVFGKTQQELADRFGLSVAEKRIAFDRDAKNVQSQPEPDEKTTSAIAETDHENDVDEEHTAEHDTVPTVNAMPWQQQ